ncbi:MAG TPA: hypothetical protein VIW24_32400 [Aldersonia sp.]
MSDSGDQRTATPLLAALAVVVVVIAIVFLVRLTSDGDSDSNRIATAATDFVAAHNAQDSAAMDRLTCSEVAPEQSPLAQQDGALELVRVAGVQGDGQRATADVTVSSGGVESTTAWVFTQVGQEWLVCGVG